MGDDAPRYEVKGSREMFTRVAEEMSLQTEPAALDPKEEEVDMNVIIDIVRSIKTSLFNALGRAEATRSAPERVKLATRNGYGDDGIPPPRP